MNHLLKLSTFVLISATMFSCSKKDLINEETMDNETVQSSDQTAKKIKVKHVNKMLVFQSRGDMILYRQTNKTLEMSSGNGIVSRETGSDGFVSMEEAYTFVTQEQANYVDYLEELEMSNPGSLTETQFNSISTQALLEYPDAFTEVTFLDGTKYLDINCGDPTMAIVVNQDGFVQIGDTLMQYSYDTLKYMVGGNPYDTEVLDHAQVSVPEDGIYVVPIAYEEYTAKLLGWGTFNSVRKSCQSTNGRARLLVFS